MECKLDNTCDTNDILENDAASSSLEMLVQTAWEFINNNLCTLTLGNWVDASLSYWIGLFHPDLAIFVCSTLNMVSKQSMYGLYDVRLADYN